MPSASSSCRFFVFLTLIALMLVSVGCGESQTPMRREPAGHDTNRTPVDGPKLLSGYGEWSLTRLGYAGVKLRGGHGRQRASVLYRLPSGARQGGNTWYLVALHFRIRFEMPADGLAYVSALHNGFASAQIKFRRETTRGEAVTIWNSVSLLTGPTRAATRKKVVTVRYRNYLPFAGVKPGVNVLTFQLEEIGTPGVADVRILADSSIDKRRDGPPLLKISAIPSSTRLKVGETGSVAVTVENVGGTALGKTGVTIDVPEGAFELMGRSTVSVMRLAPHQRFAHTFRVRALRRGPWELGVFGKSTSNHPAVAVMISVS
jgi:hypothetical protein